MEEFTFAAIEMQGRPPLVNDLLGCAPGKIDRIKREWQDDSRWLWRQALKRRSLVAPVVAHVLCSVPSRSQLHDADATALAAKWLLDACVKEGGLQDDDPQNVRCVLLNAPIVNSGSRLPIMKMALVSHSEGDEFSLPPAGQLSL